jgi:flagellar FliJ protein
MKKFSFRLETLLQHRAHREEQEREKFTRMRNEVLAGIAHRDALTASQAQTMKELGEAQCAHCDPQEVQWYERFLEYLKEEIKRSITRLAELEKKLEAQKQVMIAASRDKKIIENLKKKKILEFKFAMEREEQKMVDETVVTRYATKS